MEDAALSEEKIAVTGATGFIGSHLTRRLVRQGVRPLLPARPAARRERLADVTALVDWATVELHDTEALAATLRRARTSVLFHLAGLRGRSLGAQAYAEVNVSGTLSVLEAARQADVRRVVMVGSAAEYGPGPGPFREEFALHPASAYGASKAAATLFAQARHAADGLPVVILRPFTVYGPGQAADMFVAEAVAHAVTECPFTVRDGGHRQDLVYVEDTVQALLMAALAPKVEGQVINVGGGTSPTLGDIARRVWRLTGTTTALQIGAGSVMAGDGHDTSADRTRARELLGWSPRTDLETGLRLTIEAARAAKEHTDV